MMNRDLKDTVLKHLHYCESHDWSGIDPYDALNSKLFSLFPFLDFKLFRFGMTQVLKRIPFNIRPLLLIEGTQNPKGIACFLAALIKLTKAGVIQDEGRVQYLIERLIAMRSQGGEYWYWGYSFPWQTRVDLVNRWEPNLVCTFFVADALLDAYEQTGDARCLNIAANSAEWFLNELYWTDGNSEHGFAYPLPGDHSQVPNANLLASALLCRIYACTGEKKFLEPALNVARCAASQQYADGSWDYEPSVKWRDNFHTGYNLMGLQAIARYAQTSEFDECIRRGLEYYLANFFADGGVAKYYDDRTYPIDTHSIAQSIITLVTLADLNPSNLPLAYSVYRWAMNHLWDDKGFFYYRKLKFMTIRIPYMRWTQAWMLLAFSTLLTRKSDSQPTYSSADSALAGRA
jgi:rhamnogalacturonyl hydrolase YesR